MNKEDRYTTYRLKYPVEYGGTLITELKIRRPKGKHLRLLPGPGTPPGEAMAEIMAALAGQPPQLIDDLEGEDWFAVHDMVDNFLSGLRRFSSELSASSPESPSI